MKLKLDLHTHIWEAFNFQPPSVEMAAQVVNQVKLKGIDGIAITDHHNKDWAYEFKELVEEHFPGQMVIIPGWEIEIRPPNSPFDEYQVTELFLETGSIFRTYCHPGYYSPNIIIEENIHAIEIDNYIHNWHIRKPQVQAIADSYGLMTVQVSDAHNLENIGLRYTEVTLQELHDLAG
ncbi:MAG: PHP domain-containing protein [Chloroflexota bacterium]|nr:PHP domain-containing protein [Chloroflexota bacterium]